MTRRERVMKALNHELPDRTPVHVIGVDEPERYFASMGVSTGDELTGALDLDVAYVRSYDDYAGPELPENVSIWGTPVFEEGNGRMTTYSESRGAHPLSDAGTVGDVERHAWPSAENYRYDILRTKAASCGDAARILFMGWEPVFCRVLDLFGAQEAMVRHWLDPGTVEAVIERISDFLVSRARMMLEAAADSAEAFWFGDDFASERGMIISPDMWRRFYRPTYRRIFDLVKAHGLKVWFHSCGSPVEVLPDLVDMGMDVWETCQMHLAGNDPATLKRDYGRHLSFFGGISTQRTLPFGTEEEIRAEVRQRIDVLAQRGGYICGPDHSVRPEVPLGSLLALLDEARRYRNASCHAP